MKLLTIKSRLGFSLHENDLFSIAEDSPLFCGSMSSSLEENEGHRIVNEVPF